MPESGVGDHDSPDQTDQLFFEDVVRHYVDAPGYIRRDWLEAAIQERLAQPECRYVVLLGEPGAGKTGVMAGLASRQPTWLRYFIRRDSTTAISGGDAVSMLLRVGHQLAARRPALFDPERLEVVVTQRVAAAGADASVIGVRIGDLAVSPFHRTAIRVEQHVAGLDGALIGIDVARATVEPRLLAEENLQFLALLDPARALAEADPDAMIVILLDAMDEALRSRGGLNVLDWLERSPELPANVRVVLSSRPHARLSAFADARSGSVAIIDLADAGDAVATDTRSFAVAALASPALAGRVSNTVDVASAVATASEGNFAYLRAWERGLLAAVAEGNSALVDRLLRAHVLPAGLGALYTVFLRSARAEIEQLGRLDIETPRGPDDDSVPAWEGAGQRVTALLAVAHAPLDIRQLLRLGSIRVWPSAVESVMQHLRPLLDHVDGTWRYFHPSVAEFLVGEAEAEAPDLFVRGAEWHTRVVRAYRAGVAWRDVQWDAVDDYGILHLADHLVDLGPGGRREIVELVNPALWAAARRRFLTDLPLQGIVQAALSHLDHAGDPAEALADALFLAIVHADLRNSGARVPPAVFGLMARTGRFAEAKGRIDLLPPSEHRFVAMQALVACTTTSEPQLPDAKAGADLLAATAIEVPIIDESLFPGIRHRTAMEAAALAMAPHDLDRALELAIEAEPEWAPGSVRDAVLLTAARTRTDGSGAALVDRMGAGRAAAAAELAAAADPAQREHLLALAESDVTAGRAESDCIALARLVAAWAPVSRSRADGFGAALRTSAAPGAENRHLLTAAEVLADADPDLADALLDRVAASDGVGSWERIAAVRLWASLGRTQKARELADRVLGYERGLDWYGPASSIAELAVAVATFDPAWARSLADEAEQLVLAAAKMNTDPYETRPDSTLGSTARAFRSWDPSRALRLVRSMAASSWISGTSWDSFDGRQAGLACLGLDASGTDLPFARALLEECLPTREPDTRLGRPDAQIIRGGLFRPAHDVEDSGPSTSRMTSFVTYLANAVNYWVAARERLPFLDPADVARCMQMAPGVVGSTASWASAVSAAVRPIAAVDLDAAIDVVGWLDDPAERLICLAGLVRELVDAGDERSDDAVAAIGRSAIALPRYRAEVDLTKVDQAPMLMYLDPSARARWEAALLLPFELDDLGRSLVTAANSWYLMATWDAQRVADRLALASEHPARDEVLEYVELAVAQADASPDPIHGDLIRLSAVWVAAAWDRELAARILDRIENPGRACVGRLYLAARTSGDARELSAAAKQIAADAAPEVGLMYRVLALASAAAWLDDDDDAQELIDSGATLLADADAWSAASGQLQLAAVATSDRCAYLTRAAAASAESIGNTYLRADCLADLLVGACESGDVELVTTIARRQLETGWQVLMEGLRRSAVPLVALAGTAVFARLDRAFRAAQAVVGPTYTGLHLDGVAHPEHRDRAPIGRAATPARRQAEDIAALFLQADDLPGMALVQDSSPSDPDLGDYAFDACDGVGTGMRIWLAEPTRPVWRLNDIRFVFPDAERAAAYHAERSVANSENNPPVPDAPLAGEECTVFGGTQPLPVGDRTMTAYFYLFRVGRVVVKLFVAQGPGSASTLGIGDVHAVARRIVSRLAGAAT